MGTANDAITCVKTARAHLEVVLDPATPWPARKGHLDMAQEFVKAAGNAAMKTMLASSSAAGIVLPGQSDLEDEIERREDEQRRAAATHRTDATGVVETPADSDTPARTAVIVELNGDQVVVATHRVAQTAGEDDDAFDARVQSQCAIVGGEVCTHPELLRYADEDGVTGGALLGCPRCGTEWPECLASEAEQARAINAPATVGEAERAESGAQRSSRDEVAQNMVLATLQRLADLVPETPGRSAVELAGITGLSTVQTRVALKALSAGDTRVQQTKRGVWAWVETTGEEPEGVDLEGTAISAARGAAETAGAA
jgi:hypothetical protein